MIPAICTALIAAGLLAAQTADRQAALGSQLAAEMARHTTALDSPVTLDFVRLIGDRLATQLPDAQPAYHFALVADDDGEPTHHPAVLPGGYVFVPAKLILAAENEDELAGMIAHAMAHRTLTATGALANYGTIPIVYLGGWVPNARLPEQFQQRQKAMELDADHDAASAMSAAGYNPTALLQYLTRSFAARDRLDALRSSIGPETTHSRPSAAFLAIQDEVRRLMPERKPPTLFR